MQLRRHIPRKNLNFCMAAVHCTPKSFLSDCTNTGVGRNENLRTSSVVEVVMVKIKYIWCDWFDLQTYSTTAGGNPLTHLFVEKLQSTWLSTRSYETFTQNFTYLVKVSLSIKGYYMSRKGIRKSQPTTWCSCGYDDIKWANSISVLFLFGWSIEPIESW